MKKAGLIIAVVAVVIVIFSLAKGVSAPEAWYKYQPQDAAFEILLPGAPEKLVLLSATPYGTLHLQVGKVEFLDVSYVVSYAAVPEAVMNSMPGPELLRSNLAAYEKDGYIKLAEATDYVDGNPALYSSWGSPDGEFRIVSQNILTGDRLHHLIVSTHKDELEFRQRDIKKFFASFRLK